MQVTCCERLIHSDMYRIIRIDANNKHKERIFMHERPVCLGKPGNNTNQKPWIESPLEGTAQTVIVGGYSGPASGERYFYFFTFLISILARYPTLLLITSIASPFLWFMASSPRMTSTFFHPLGHVAGLHQSGRDQEGFRDKWSYLFLLLKLKKCLQHSTAIKSPVYFFRGFHLM